MNAPCHLPQVPPSSAARRRRTAPLPSSGSPGASFLTLRGPALLCPVSALETGEELLAAVGRPLGTCCWTLSPQQAASLTAANVGLQSGRHLPPAVGGLFARLVAEISQVRAIRTDYRGCVRARLPAKVDVSSVVRVRGQLLAASEMSDTGVECTIRLMLETDGDPRLMCLADVVIRFYFAARPQRAALAQAQGRRGNPALFGGGFPVPAVLAALSA